MYEYKREYHDLLLALEPFSLSLSLCLPSSHKYWTDLIVGGGSAGHPRLVFVVLQVRARMKRRL
jgi:hypothetical protein